ncbi:MAG: hypothetical protein H7336_04665 [Bacteriovorax sp.]|nr:hypothetical protein [Bacteriovorax sp.]
MKKSFLVKSITGLLATTIIVCAITYSIVRINEPQLIDFSAFKNAAANIQYISESRENKLAGSVADVTGSIVKTIEKEVREKILRSRYSVKPKTVIVEKVIAKNWNDIKPAFAAVDMKLDEVKLSVVAFTNDEAFEFEINNRELIKLYGLEVDSLQYESFTNTQVASADVPSLDVIKEDMVQIAQASTTTQVQDVIAPETAIPAAPPAETQEEIAQAEIATKANLVNDDLVVFDYSSDKKAAASNAVKDNATLKKMFDVPLSSSVKEAIAREVGKPPAVAMNVNTQRKAFVDTQTEKSDLDKVMEDEDNLVFDYSKQSAAAVSKKETVDSAVSAFTAASAPNTAAQADFIIKVKEINLNTLKSRQSFGFEFVPDYDRAERTDDQTSGEIKLGYSLSGDVNTQTGVVQSQGLISTRVELNLLSNGVEVPMFNEEGIQKFLEKNKTDIQGNLLMVALDPSIVDVEIDSEYQFKLYLSDKFKLMDSQVNASYVLFLGVKTGNVALRYLLSNKESAQKIVYVGDGEMYFEDPDFVNTQREMYTFTTRSLLGRKVKELNINGSDISFFGTKTFAKKKALNVYEIKVPELVNNTRKYLEFKHLGNSLFVGTDSAKEIEIPGKDFIGKVLEANDMSEIGSRCLVQINLTKDLRDIKANGKNKNGEMFTETTYLDNDGNFSRDNLELSEKVFVTGDMEGLFNVRLDYTDGTTDFLKTFCSEGSYLIEQL